jgi:NADH:ubiquinone oxidoreductase subunit 3 (subunit A)
MGYGTLLSFLIVAILFGVAAIAVNRLLSPHRPSKVKNATYECGNEPTGDAQVRYNIRFYTFALLYVVFAIESAFLFPWAVVFRAIEGLLPLFAALAFLAALVLALAYAWRKGALTWD